ncbi:transcriptional regulator [Aquipseudomonas alcaligenes]|uniref:ORF6C domain-containing protein n=1 Tax=Aquipseudomonas alcaligenes TaxID=43263 RepID=A0AA42ST80_AQUAC|nr:transcriptional regulator [Pseudomonas alcaligenes]MDH1055619.1 ORF6C domain-containing protein [Pseudomonas alcaligenes]
MSVERADIAIRLVEERGRTGYSRVAFARELGISAETLRLYEIGQSALNAEVLAKAASLGVDVQYVLTGVRSVNALEAEKAARPEVSVSSGGSANVVQFAQNGSTIHMVSTQKHVTHTRAEVKPGEQHISEAQAAKLTELVHEVVELEAKLKKAPKGFRAVWGALNAHCDVTRYLLIAAEDYEKAEKYLRQWIGRLNSMASAPVADNDAWRKRRYSYIKINTKDDSDWLVAYLKKTFKVTSLTELSDEQLDRTYRAVAARKRKPRSPNGA